VARQDIAQHAPATTLRFPAGTQAQFEGQACVVLRTEGDAEARRCYCEVGPCRLPMWLPEDRLAPGLPGGEPEACFHAGTPHVLMVDNFYKDPDGIRRLALLQDFVESAKVYKGRRTVERFLWPHLREAFERLLGRPILDWLHQPANGCFQITGFDDPLVWHSDLQSYAAAVYLTPDAPLNAGTSFWRDRLHGLRRPPTHRLDAPRLAGGAERLAVQAGVYREPNILRPDNWELVDRVGAVYNRLVLWDAKLIHSASSYEGLDGSQAGRARLVQLFFFTVEDA